MSQDHVSIVQSFNRLTPAEHERLSVLMEEMGEAIQAIGKVFRHGYETTHPDGGPTNRDMLENELGDVRYAMIAICEAGDLSKAKIHDWADIKRHTIGRWLHHQELP